MKQLLMIMFLTSLFVPFKSEPDYKLLKKQLLVKASPCQISVKQINGNEIEIISILNDDAENTKNVLTSIDLNPERRLIIESMPKLKPQLRPP